MRKQYLLLRNIGVHEKESITKVVLNIPRHLPRGEVTGHRISMNFARLRGGIRAFSPQAVLEQAKEQ